MSADAVRLLLGFGQTSTVALLLACLLRKPLRRAFGAGIAYHIWAAVPLALFASMLPADHLAAPVQHFVAPLGELRAWTQAASGTAAPQWHQWLLFLWLSGSTSMLAWTWYAQALYRRRLAPLRLRDGLLYSTGASQGPAVIGLWRPAIVVPADFADRYTRQEQQLILAHEAVHVRRRDPIANGICALLQCALWFHPLAHYAARRFRLDQELACDEAVMRAHPGCRRSYAEAMLKTQLSAQGSAIHCHWNSPHPLKERIMQLHQSTPRKSRRPSGRLAIAAILTTCTYATMVAHADADTPAASYRIKMELEANGESTSPGLLVKEGVPFAVASEGKSGVWRTELVLSKASDSTVLLKTVVRHDKRIVGTPALLVPLDSKAAIAVHGDEPADNFKLSVAVSRQRD